MGVTVVAASSGQYMSLQFSVVRTSNLLLLYHMFYVGPIINFSYNCILYNVLTSCLDVLIIPWLQYQ
jgi:hypothetical protein